MIICFDYGHGGKDPGACYMGRRESQEVLSIGKEIAKLVRKHGIVVDETRTTDTTVSLAQRCQFENRKNYDFFVSFHRNAYKPEIANGAEVYTYLDGGQKAYTLAKNMQEALITLGFKNRGLKKANFQVLRDTRAPAVLVEMGFIDHTEDNKLFDQQKEKIIEALGKAIIDLE